MKSTADLCDENENVEILAHDFIHAGQKKSCSGQIETVLVNEDNAKIIEALKGNGKGKVLVAKVEGEKCAVVGDRLAGIAIENGWEGIIVDGFIRDTEEINTMNIGIWARGTYPQRSRKKAEGQKSVAIQINEITLRPGQDIYADQDGIVVIQK